VFVSNINISVSALATRLLKHLSIFDQSQKNTNIICLLRALRLGSHIIGSYRVITVGAGGCHTAHKYTKCNNDTIHILRLIVFPFLCSIQACKLRKKSLTKFKTYGTYDRQRVPTDGTTVESWDYTCCAVSVKANSHRHSRHDKTVLSVSRQLMNNFNVSVGLAAMRNKIQGKTNDEMRACN